MFLITLHTLLKGLLRNKIGSFHIYILLFATFLIEKSFCYYPITIRDRSLKIQPFLASAATVVYNDVIYVYGGLSFDLVNETDTLYSYTLHGTTGEMVVSLVSINEGPICSTCSVVLYPETSEIWVFAEPRYSIHSKFYKDNAPDKGRQIVVPHIYNIINKTWSILPVDTYNGNYSTFFGRSYQTTVLGNDGTVYVLGGVYQADNGDLYRSTYATASYGEAFELALSNITDGWYYNKTENSYNVMSLPNSEPYVYASGFIDLDGNIALLFGSNATVNEHNSYYYDGSKLNIYNTVTKSWSVKSTVSPPLAERFAYGQVTTQVDYDRKLLYALGGRKVEDESVYSSQFFFVFDLVNNVWYNGNEIPGSEAPITLSSASSALIMNNTYFIRLFGVDDDLQVPVALNSLDILKVSFNKPFDNEAVKRQALPIEWISTTLSSPTGYGMSTSLIIASILFSIILVTVLGLCMFTYGKSYIPHVWHDFKNNTLWSKRKGEPIWVEVSRLVMRVFSFLILATFLIYNINNVLTSPVSELSFTEYVDAIAIPDIRICFTGWESSEFPDVACSFDIVSDYNPCDLIPLRISNYTPYYDNQLARPDLTTCFLYAPSPLNNVTAKNTTITITSNGYTYGNNEAIFIQLYRPKEDINRIVYLDETLPGINSVDVQEWSLTDTQSDLQVDIFPNSYTSIYYQEIHHQDIRDDIIWNYFGLFPIYTEYTNLTLSHTPPIIPNLVGEAGEPLYFYNSIAIKPESFTKITVTQKRDNTILDIIGAIGGVVGLVFGLQIYLFGHRPTKPWGVIQRRTGKYNRLSNELNKNFYLHEAQIPLVTPVHPRFVDISSVYLNEKQEDGSSQHLQEIGYLIDEPLVDRVSRLEARNQLLEMVLKAYYIDDEVFIALDYARKHSNHFLEEVVTSSNSK